MITLTETLTYKKVSNSDLLNLISTNSITPGYSYLIDDEAYTDGGVLVQGVSSNSVSNSGSGIFLNADYEGVGVYTNVPSYVNNLGIWVTAPVPVVSVGSVVVYDNRNYVNLTGSWGTAPSGDTTNWSLLPKGVSFGYIQEIDAVTYDISNNRIISRADRRGNYVEINFGSSPLNIDKFQWGRNKIANNIVIGGSIINAVNSPCAYFKNVLSSQSTITDNTNQDTIGEVFSNNLEQGQITINLHFGKIRFNKLLSGNINIIGSTATTTIISTNTINAASSIDVTTCLGEISGNFLAAGGVITGTLIDATSRISRNTITSNGSIFVTTMLTSVIEENVVQNFELKFSGISFSTIDSSYFTGNGGGLNVFGQLGTIANCQIETRYAAIVLNNMGSHNGKTCRAGYSDFELAIDFSTLYDLATKTLNLPNNNFYGVYKLSNTASNIVKTISGTPTGFPIKFIPNAGQIVNFEHTAIALATSGMLVSNSGAVTNTLTGRTNGGDFAQYQRAGNLLELTNIFIGI
jgi:hypothetical protein